MGLKPPTFWLLPEPQLQRGGWTSAYFPCVMSCIQDLIENVFYSMFFKLRRGSGDTSPILADLCVESIALNWLYWSVGWCNDGSQETGWNSWILKSCLVQRMVMVWLKFFLFCITYTYKTFYWLLGFICQKKKAYSEFKSDLLARANLQVLPVLHLIVVGLKHKRQDGWSDISNLHLQFQLMTISIIHFVGSVVGHLMIWCILKRTVEN